MAGGPLLEVRQCTLRHSTPASRHNTFLKKQTDTKYGQSGIEVTLQCRFVKMR